jgi:hypothetical protein
MVDFRVICGEYRKTQRNRRVNEMKVIYFLQRKKECVFAKGYVSVIETVQADSGTKAGMTTL